MTLDNNMTTLDNILCANEAQSATAGSLAVGRTIRQELGALAGPMGAELGETERKKIVSITADIVESALEVASRALAASSDRSEAVDYYRGLVIGVLQVLQINCGVGGVLALVTRGADIGDPTIRKIQIERMQKMGDITDQEIPPDDQLDKAVLVLCYENVTDEAYQANINQEMPVLSFLQPLGNTMNSILSNILRQTLERYPAPLLVDPKPNIILPGPGDGSSGITLIP